MQIIGVVLLICAIILPAAFEEIDKENESKGRYPRQVTTGTGTGTGTVTNSPIRFNGRIVLRPVTSASNVDLGSWAYLTQTSAPIQIITTRPQTGTGTNLGTGTFNFQLRPVSSSGTSGISTGSLTGTLGSTGTSGSTNLGTLTLNSRKGRKGRSRSNPRKNSSRSKPRSVKRRSMPRSRSSPGNQRRRSG